MDRLLKGEDAGLQAGGDGLCGVEVRLSGGEMAEGCVEGLGEGGDVGVGFLERAEGGAVGEERGEG
jgi:hypothetical protein